MRRLALLKFLLLVAWLGFLGYAFTLQVVSGRRYGRLARNQHEIKVEILPQRGRIFDCRLRPLAVNVSCFSIYALPRYVRDKTLAASVLSAAGVAGYNDILSRLRHERAFFWVRKKFDYTVGAKLKQTLEEKELSNAIVCVEDTRRAYPWSWMAASVLGFVGEENNGLAGIEYQFDRTLAGKPGWAVLQKSPLGDEFPYPSYPAVKAEDGKDLYLTLDAELQEIVATELAAAVDSSAALGGTVIVLELPSGAVRALVDYPDFDPGAYEKFPPSRWKISAIADEFEPGSSFKHVMAAACLERKLAVPTEKLSVKGGKIQLAGYTISDVHDYGTLTFSEIFEKSSNVGVVKLSRRIDAPSYYEVARRLGFGAPTGIELPGEARGYLDRPNEISRLRLANMAFGQGVRVTALQLAASYACLASRGLFLRPTIVAGIDSVSAVKPPIPVVVRQALSESTCTVLNDILARAVAQGTGQNARLAEFTVCGKTGTAQKAVPGAGYSSQNLIVSFVGFFPKEAPQMVIAVVIDQPARACYASELACPLFRRIAERAVRIPEFTCARK